MLLQKKLRYFCICVCLNIADLLLLVVYLFCPGGALPDGFTLFVVNPLPLQLPCGVLPPPFEHWVLIAAYAPLTSNGANANADSAAAIASMANVVVVFVFIIAIDRRILA